MLAGCVDDPSPTPGLSGSASAGGSAPTTTNADDGASEPSESTAPTDSADGDATADTDPSDDDDTNDDDTNDDGATTTASSGPVSDDTGVDDGTTAGGESSSTGEPGDLDDGILDITIIAHNDCTFTTVPPAIAVPEGTAFTVNWISAANSEIELDIAKIDAFNAVPIIIGMEPGTSYHDEVREWCGDLFNGTFDFRITSCFDPVYIPVDCSA